MVLKYLAARLSQITAATTVYFVPQFDKITDRELKGLDTAVSGAVSHLRESSEFSGKSGEMTTLFNPAGYKTRKVILVGLGARKELNADSFRKAAGSVSRFTTLTTSRKAAFYLDDFDSDEIYQAVIEGYMLGSFKLLDFKTGDDKKDKNVLGEITFVVNNPKRLGRVEKAVERGHIIAEGQLLVRTLGATPANYLTPRILAQKAQQLARSHRFSCRVLDEKEIAKEKMGALLAVGQGSDEPPRFIVLEHKGAAAGRHPIVLVGKGVTFDSGGISIKPSLDMHEMKGDMCGAAVVLASVMTAARLKLPHNIVGLIPVAENMPSGKALKPGDIITSRKGLTIEIISTDAEGRLILADALDYANKFKPQAVVDIATLTGAALYILGYSGAPIMGNNPKLLQRLKEAAETTGERVWELPMWDDFGERMKSPIADLKNSGGRPAPTITAAAFLEKFIGDYPWAHVDIAYVDTEPSGKPYIPVGTTGIGLRLFVEMLSGWKKL